MENHPNPSKSMEIIKNRDFRNSSKLNSRTLLVTLGYVFERFKLSRQSQRPSLHSESRVGCDQYILQRKNNGISVKSVKR